MADLNLISAGFAAIFGGDARTNSIHDLIGKTYIMGQSPIPTFSYLPQIIVGGGPAPSELMLNTDELDPTYDYDLSNVHDDGSIYMRGGYLYQRPYGWNRIAIKVVGRYEYGDVWLGSDGIRTKQAPGEWPVSYHGTNISHANAIVEEGFKPGPRALHGKGIYTSPSLEMVERLYAQQFTHKGKTYKIAFQNRVNTASLNIIPASRTGVGADYWLSTNPCDVRPYGVLIREV